VQTCVVLRLWDENPDKFPSRGYDNSGRRYDPFSAWSVDDETWREIAREEAQERTPAELGRFQGLRLLRRLIARLDNTGRGEMEINDAAGWIRDYVAAGHVTEAEAIEGITGGQSELAALVRESWHRAAIRHKNERGTYQ
jgi:hypothetical protein